MAKVLEQKNKKFLVVGLVAVIIILAAAGFASYTMKNKSQERQVVRFGSGGASGQAGVFQGIAAVAKELGYLDEELDKVGFDVEFYMFSNGGAVNEAIATGEIDLASMGDVPTAVAMSNDIGTTWIGVGVSPLNYTVITSPKSDIEVLEDLEGKKIAYNIGTASQKLYEVVVNEFSLDESKIEGVNLTETDGINALLTGDVDAVIAPEKNAVVMEHNGEAKIVFSTAEYPEWASQNLLIGRTEFLEEHPEVAVALHKACIRAREAMIEDPQVGYVALSAHELEETPELGDKIYNKDNGQFLNIVSGITEESIQREQDLVDFLYSIGKITTQVNVKDYVDNSYYEEAVK